MRRVFLILFLLLSFWGNAQDETYDLEVLESAEETIGNRIKSDTTYTKDLEYSKKRAFEKDLDTKYSGRDFTYEDKLKKPKDPKPYVPSEPVIRGSSGAFSSFMSTIFPIILAIVVVLIILKSFVNIEAGFWNIKTAKKEKAVKLISEDDDIDQSDYNALLQRAIANGNYRLATRYYYLSLLKKLSHNNYIEYHKDKTNSEYLFELKNKSMRSNFSYLSYIYSYVWYGESSVDEMKFKTIESKYKSFIETIK
jgi:hypothetical protein